MDAEDTFPSLHELKTSIDGGLQSTFVLQDLPRLVEAFNSNDLLKQHYGVIGIRKLLSNEEDPPIQAVLDSEILPRLMEFMKLDEHPHLQLEAAWALCNIASGNSQQVSFVVEYGGIPEFVRLLKSPRPEVVEQAIWGLGNIAADNYHYRDLILDQGTVPLIISALAHTYNVQTVRHAIRTMSNLCKGKPDPDFAKIRDAFPIFCEILQTESDVETLSNAAWGLKGIFEANVNGLHIAFPTGFILTLIKNLENPNIEILRPCLLILGEIILHNQAHTTNLIKTSGFTSNLFNLLDHDKTFIRKDACWVISNITAGAPENIDGIFSNLVYFKKAIDSLCYEPEETVRQEASHILSNAACNCTEDRAMEFFGHGVLDVFVTLLETQNIEILMAMLKGIEGMLDRGVRLGEQTEANINPFLQKLEENGGVEKIESLQLQTHQDERVYQLAFNILSRFFL